MIDYRKEKPSRDIFEKIAYLGLGFSVATVCYYADKEASSLQTATGLVSMLILDYFKDKAKK